MFARSDGARVFGPGHDGFFKSPDGTEEWIVCHANDSASGVCDTHRTTRAQPIAWRGDGTPDFGSPLSLDSDILEPAVE